MQQWTDETDMAVSIKKKEGCRAINQVDEAGGPVMPHQVTQKQSPWDKSRVLSAIHKCLDYQSQQTDAIVTVACPTLCRLSCDLIRQANMWWVNRENWPSIDLPTNRCFSFLCLSNLSLLFYTNNTCIVWHEIFTSTTWSQSFDLILWHQAIDVPYYITRTCVPHCD